MKYFYVLFAVYVTRVRRVQVLGFLFLEFLSRTQNVPRHFDFKYNLTLLWCSPVSGKCSSTLNPSIISQVTHSTYVMDSFVEEAADLELCPTCFLLFAVPFKCSIGLFVVSSNTNTLPLQTYSTCSHSYIPFWQYFIFWMLHMSWVCSKDSRRGAITTYQ